MDIFQTDEFRPKAPVTPRPEPLSAPVERKRTAYPYTTGVLAVVVAVAGGLIASQLSGTSGFGWAAAAWLLAFVALLGRLITAVANRRSDR